MAKLGKFRQYGFARWVATWNTKIVITQVPGGPQRSEFGKNHPTISPKVLPCPKGPKLFEIHGFDWFWGVHKVAKSH